MEKPLEGKVGVVTGVANHRSIAFGIAKAWHEAGAKLIFSYQGERLKDSVIKLVRQHFGEDTAVCELDVASDESIENFCGFVATQTDRVDMLLHAIAFAPKAAGTLEGHFTDIPREAFSLSLEISAYSLIALARGISPLMTAGGSITALTYHASRQVVPNYNLMAVSKAALESCTRYLAYDLGRREAPIRVNCISAGPVQTLAARGVSGFTSMFKVYEEKAPLQRSCTLEELGAMATYLASDGGACVTGQCLYADGGYSIMAM
ncbi:MAG: enoyl-ACP reductase [Akkermansia sp.]|nr:enoyl-ACP reductase [Akkermansia sp.]